MGRKGLSYRPLVWMQVSTATVETVWTFLRRLKIERPYDLVTLLLNICPEDLFYWAVFK
jgi:hypothetical protein